MTDDEQSQRPRKLTNEQARMEQLLYWSKRTAAERLTACTALTWQLYQMRVIEINEREADFTPGRAPRRPR